jgi:TonB-linked SusC/RagA family outer membrane protein
LITSLKPKLKTVMKKSIILLAFLLLSGIQVIYAQSQTCTGMVSSADDGIGIPGASVIVKGTTVGTTTDIDGKYSIDVPENGKVLVFSFVGMETQEIEIGSQTVINVVLQTSTIGLNEVVAIGYGVTKKSDLTGSVSSVTSKDFEKQPITRLEDALQGRASGVQITKNSGAPGAAIKIRVRGTNSINGDNSPLVVIDGLIGGDLKSLNSNDIASMEILKDASATAIYGSRGANGVILVSTKKGAGKAKIDFGYFASMSRVPEKIDVLSANEFSELFDTPVVDGGTDYQDEFFKNAYAHNYQLAISGKEGKTGYFISGNVVDQSGIVINTEYDKYALRSNLDTEINEKLKVGLNTYGSYEKSLNLFNNGERTSTDLRGGVTSVLGWDPTIPIKGANGLYNLQSSFGQTLINPIAVQRESQMETSTWKLNANLNLSYQILDNLNFTVISGVVNTNRKAENYRGIPAGTVESMPIGSGAHANTTLLQNSNILTWNKELGDHKLKLTGIYEIQKSIFKNLNSSGGRYLFPYNYNAISLGTTPSVKAGLKKSTIQSWIGRGEYNYKDKLYLTATIRADESSRFRKDERLGIFPSASVAYQLDEITDNIEILDRIKLRAGYGETGNQNIDPYLTYDWFVLGENYPINGANEDVGFQLGNIGNSDLTWETTKQSNVGVDFMFLAGRLTFSFDAYWKNTTDLLLDVPMPGYEGSGTIKKNVGEVSNKGFDFAISGTIFSSQKLNWQTSFNFTHNKNKVESLNDGQKQIISNKFTNVAGGGYSLLRVGDPMGQIYGATFLGTYKTDDAVKKPGEAKYLLNDAGEVAFGVIGNGTPTTTWGFNNTLTYGAFDFNVLIRGSHGNEILNATRGLISMGGGSMNNPTYGEYRNRWTPENQTEIPVKGNNIVNSTRYIEDGSFVKLSNLSLGYTTTKIKGIKSLRIYASAQNLLTISDYKGYDPEASSSTSDNDQSSSIDLGAFPNPQTFTFGVNLGF